MKFHEMGISLHVLRNIIRKTKCNCNSITFVNVRVKIVMPFFIQCFSANFSHDWVGFVLQKLKLRKSSKWLWNNKRLEEQSPDVKFLLWSYSYSKVMFDLKSECWFHVSDVIWEGKPIFAWTHFERGLTSNSRITVTNCGTFWKHHRSFCLYGQKLKV